MRYNAILIFFIAFVLNGCAITSLKDARLDDNRDENRAQIKELSEIRSKDIVENETYYTGKLTCLGNGKYLSENAFRFSVAPIYDKTGKVFPPGSTAISDMVINSLSYVHAIKIMETPLSGDITESRTNLVNPKNLRLSKIYKDNIVNVAGKVGHIPFGILFPSDYYIIGALVQYDEATVLPSTALNLNIDAFQSKKSLETISVGLHLRLINAEDGEVQFNSTVGKRGSVMLSNRFYKINLNNSLFKIISSAGYGIDHSVTVADPKHYVIQEMVEKGVAELLSVFPNDCQ